MSYHIGVDLGGTFVKFGSVDESGNVLKKDKIPTPAGCDYGAIVSAIAEAVNGFNPAYGSIRRYWRLYRVLCRPLQSAG